jgi:uncharacterized protein GlcG (DUF336 family)
MDQVKTTAETLTLAAASRIVDEALVAGRALKLKPLSVAVLDAGGHLVAFKREDNSGILRFEVAFGKAWGALGLGRPSRGYEQVAKERPWFINSLVGASDGRLVPVAGGVLVKSAAGGIIGAVGISGDTSDNDEVCAIKGIQAVGLISEPELPPA